jgi:hypothetical protein
MTTVAERLYHDGRVAQDGCSFYQQYIQRHAGVLT